MPNITNNKHVTIMSQTENINNFPIIAKAHAEAEASKYYSKGTQIRLSDGSIKKIESLTLDDSVFDSDGKSKRITEIHQGNGMLYNISQKLGDNYIVNGKYILVLKFTNNEGIFWDANRQYFKARYIQDLRLHDKCFQHSKKIPLTEDAKEILHNKAKQFLKEKRKENGYKTGGDVIEISVEDYLKLPKNIKRVLYGFKQEVNFEEKNVEIDPYMLGMWL